MRILFDNGVPRPVASALQAHIVEEARARGWDSLANGELLTAAEAAGFEVMVTTDRNLAYQQNLSGRGLRSSCSPRPHGHPSVRDSQPLQMPSTQRRRAPVSKWTFRSYVADAGLAARPTAAGMLAP